MPSQWNLFVQKIYKEEKAKAKAKGSTYEFKQALKDASDRKSEMGKMKLPESKPKSKRKSRKSRKSKTRGKKHDKKTRKNRK